MVVTGHMIKVLRVDQGHAGHNLDTCLSLLGVTLAEKPSRSSPWCTAATPSSSDARWGRGGRMAPLCIYPEPGAALHLEGNNANCHRLREM